MTRADLAETTGEREFAHYQAAFEPLLVGVGLAMVLCRMLRETGPAAHQVRPGAAPPHTP
jgi:hypothetical protein